MRCNAILRKREEAGFNLFRMRLKLGYGDLKFSTYRARMWSLCSWFPETISLCLMER